MIKNNDTAEKPSHSLVIDKMVYGGEALARLPGGPDVSGKAVFVPFVLQGEQVQAEITQEKRSFARARLVAVEVPAPERISAPCPYFEACGGCHYQHTTYENQLQIKKGILLETLRRTARLDWAGAVTIHPSPAWNYRNRSRLQVRAGGEFILGYYKFASNQVEPVELCPISSPLINRGIAAVWEAGRAGKIAADVREIEFFANADDTAMLLQVYVEGSSVAEQFARELAELLSEALPAITGLIFCTRRGEGAEAGIDRDFGWTSIGVAGDDHLLYQTTRGEYRVSGGAFFQINRYLLDELIQVAAGDGSGALALDLYAGVGLFSKVLAQNFALVYAVESSPMSFADLRHNLPGNARAVQSTTEHFLAKAAWRAKSPPASPPPPPDLVVVDPPRAGLGEKVTKLLAATKTARVSYVSCDPATLSRDLRGLLESGYRVDEVHLFDLFPQTFHIESVVRLRRQ